MSTFIVKGGNDISGTYSVSGAKNAGPKLIIAAMLSDQEVVVHNIPRISDTEKIMEAIRGMGGEAQWTGDSDVRVNCANVSNPEVPEVVLSARHAVLFIGATLARLGKLRIARIGGDEIGKRPVDRLLAGLKHLGATMNDDGEWTEMTFPDRPAATTYGFEKSTHTGTESLLLGSIFADGVIVLENAAQEPEVDNLIELLNDMGAKVVREERTLTIAGVPKLLGAGEATSMYDRLEGATAMALSVLAGGAVKVKNVEPSKVFEFVEVLEKTGVKVTFDGTVVSLEPPEVLTPTKVVTSIYPGFMTDWQPLMTMLLGVLSNGTSEIHETIYEKRWGTLQELGKMGVKYELFEPEGYTKEDFNFNDEDFKESDFHGAYVTGPATLKGAEVESLDVRAGIGVLIAALFAEGESTINDPKGHIDRGYSNIVGKLQALGAEIKRTDS